jgi:hypothetical protein
VLRTVNLASLRGLFFESASGRYGREVGAFAPKCLCANALRARRGSIARSFAEESLTPGSALGTKIGIRLLLSLIGDGYFGTEAEPLLPALAE